MQRHLKIARPRRLAAGLLAALALASFAPTRAIAQQDPPPPPIVGFGDVVVSGFSGVVAPDPKAPKPANKTAVDLTFLDPNGPAARIVDVSSPDEQWDAKLWPAGKPRDVLAKDVGQVFGIALDDEQAPNIYLGATSLFGLHIDKRLPDGSFERLKTGGPGAQWQTAQFGVTLQGGPGSIYKVDGRTGVATLFANVTLNGVPNPGPGLGNLAYDAAHKQLFVSDLYTGMIHRFSTVDGSEAGPAFDHGVAGRTAAQLQPMPFDPRTRPNIATPAFDSLKPETWGYAPPERRVWAVALQGGRLYYSVRNGSAQDGPQIWSVGIAQDGSFAGDPQWELDVPAQPGPYAVSDIAFSRQGAMILAQRAPSAASYDYTAFTQAGEPRVLRYWLENPDDPKTPSKWIAQPEEYAVGFAGTYRNTNGGVALGYGYANGQDGRLGLAACEYSLWTTGQNLRNAPALRTQLEPGGPLVVHGLQASPAAPVRNFNEPPQTTYFVDYDDRFVDPAASGHLGSVRALPCAEGTVVDAGPGYPAQAPYVVGGLTADTPADSVNPTGGNPPGGGGGGGGGGGECTGPNCWPGTGTKPIDIALKKTAGSARYDKSSGKWLVDFTLDVRNVGNSFAPWNAIGISDPVPAGFTYVGASGTNWTCNLQSSNVNCANHAGSAPFNTGAHLPPLVLHFSIAAPGKFENCAVAGVDRRRRLVETERTNNRDCAKVDISPQPVDIALAKTAGTVTYDAPSGTWTIKFTLDVSNAGGTFVPGNAIAISDAVPAGMTFVSASGTNWQCPAGPPPALTSGSLACTYNYGSGTFANGAHLNPLVVTATTKTAGKVENCATASIAPGGDLSEVALANNRGCATVETKSPVIDVGIAKTGTAQVHQGAPTAIAFNLAVTNVGPAFTGTNAITVTDVVPAGMTFTGATGPNWTCATLPVAAGGTLTCTYTGTGPATAGAALGTIAVSATATTAGPWTNCADVAVAASAGLDGNAENNHSCTTLTGGGFVPVNPPPPVHDACGQNVIFVVDESGSISSPNDYSWNVRSALTNAASVLNNNGAKAAVIYFSDNASVVQPLGTAAWGNITNGYAPAGGTNWEAAMTKALGLLPSAGANTVIVFITDGVPTAYLDNSGNVVFTTDSVLATNEAIPVVNQIYAAGIPIVGLGIGNISTHMNALLGGNVHASSYGGIDSDLTTISRQLCPGLYLTKSISPGWINFHYTTSHQVPVTLSLTNTGGALTNVVVQDALPAELTNPTGFTASAGSASGNPVNWTIPTLAANATATLTFQGTIATTNPPPTNGNYYCIKNFAQVTSKGGVSESAADLMANAVTGPVHQPDEATSNVCVQDWQPTQTTCTTPPTLTVKKTSLSEVCKPAPQGGTSSAPCTFTITVTNSCAAFNGPVVLGEGLFSSSGTPVTASIASVTSAPSTTCSWGASTPSTCTANISLQAYQSMTFTVTLGGSIPDGNYKNCFLADGKTPAPVDYSSAYSQVNPTTSIYGDPWGNCTNFIVANPPQMPPAPIPPIRRVNVPPTTCTAPFVPGAAAGSCVCPQGTVQRGRECVKPQTPPHQACTAPFVPGAAAGSCVCPQGTVQQGRDCVKTQTPPQACAAPFVPGAAAGSCICPQGTVQEGRQCVKTQTPPHQACTAPFVPGAAAGSCVCPQGTVQEGRQCVKAQTSPHQACTAPFVPGAAGSCVCPQGTVQQGRECVPHTGGGLPQLPFGSGTRAVPGGGTQHPSDTHKTPGVDTPTSPASPGGAVKQ